MGEPLRFRDARNNSNKCYSIFFDAGGEQLTASRAKAAKIKSTRSPPKKKSRKTRIMTATPWVMGATGALQVGGSDTVNQATDAFSNTVTTITTATEVLAPSGSKNLNEIEDSGERRIATVEEEKCVCDAVGARKDQDGESKNVGESRVGHKMTLHVVDCYDEPDEGIVESESWQSNNNNKRKFSACPQSNNVPMPNSRGRCEGVSEVENTKKQRLISVKDEMFELFQAWALHTYGDQAKTKTITRRKKNRILKALDGKEHNNPDSSKFRFWVKSKGFTTHRPDNFSNSSAKEGGNMLSATDIASSISNFKNETHNSSSTTSLQEAEKIKDNIDLYVASTVTDYGERVYRKVAVVEQFFDIIYNIHVDQGGRNGRHAGQKRTYRIITETYAFLPREAVTKFLSSCPSCKKNLRPFSPGRFEDTINESSSEFEVFNYSSQNESSVDSTHLGPMHAVRRKLEVKASPLVTSSYSETVDPTAILTKCDRYLENRVRLNDYTDKPTTQTYEKTESVKKESNLLESSNLQKGFNLTEKFESGNLSSINKIKDKISLHDKISLENKLSWTEKWMYDVTEHKRLSNCYDYLNNPYGNKSYHFGANADLDTFVGQYINEEKESCVDLKIKQANYININIGNSIVHDKQSSPLNSTPVKVDTVADYNINSLDVSINMSNTSKEFKISCKTTPPKKRYSIFKDNDNDLAIASLPRAGNHRAMDSKECRKDSHLSKLNLPVLIPRVPTESDSFQIDLSNVKPITSTYLRMTRSFGLSDAEALRIDDLESGPTPSAEAILPEVNPEDAYAGLMKDADKLKLMLLAWNYQNSNAIRNGSEAPDLSVVGGLWAQYQNALALNTKQPSVSPVNRTEQPSPIENQDETNSSGQKDEDDASEDDSDDKLDQNAHDPERLKAFNMFVRLFVDENLDRMIPISKQPKEKIQAIIDSCARQFPEFCERSRKRIRTYLKSCRRNKKTREGWDNSSRPTPAHLTSVQAEQILAIACENESMNAKRMRIGLDPISQSLPLAANTTVTTDVVAPSITYPGFRVAPSTTTAASTEQLDSAQAAITTQSMVGSARSSPISLTTTMPAVSVDSKMSASSVNGCLVTSQIASPLYRPADFTSPSSTSSPYSSSVNRPATSYPAFFPTSTSASATPTDLSMKQQPQPTTLQATQPLPTLATSTAAGSSVAATGRPPLLSHKLNPNEMSAVRQLITGYRESAAFLLRSADELEQLLLQQQ